jgi:hypothetical protein
MPLVSSSPAAFMGDFFQLATSSSTGTTLGVAVKRISKPQDTHWTEGSAVPNRKYANGEQQDAL